MTEETVNFEEFKKLDLRVAIVESAEKIEGTDKLVKLSIKMGSEKRQLVAGIADQYAPDAIKGKKIVVIRNLQPRTVKNVESQGMLLAAVETNGKVSLLVPDRDVADGTHVA
ncbi:methionine--tRNA ligase subunit beta [Candidatus Micrarchaeota archaeon]|nr:MAG: methionine--tRNA ligase subunit beta [Candidatus Micrarchaeota archaeon]